ncbi:sorbosone dehydrogenase family protein [Paraflavitalea sp. CAU 1676]|uniref:PQQ-dependent sugar dehydrogenase n=1 Tax=Paraflavitalea sp. CAU 1676 TaxID=3032598 RepID=UPI0023DAD4DA|nr:sorbosone dehydrogenase family protein [Paraflavitalea sp. CAU 1676]MDF2193134.1 sorbosone dehydrogenase family protein [Paraflavitalea sp. CAU 1676]
MNSFARLFPRLTFPSFRKSITPVPACLRKCYWLLPALVLAACSSDKPKVPGTPAEADSLYSKYQLDKIKLPPGFKLSVYAVVPNARSMCWGSQGTLFVGNKDDNSVYAVVDTDRNGRADTVYTVAKNLTMPNGVAFREGSLYVAEMSRIIRFDNIESQLANPPSPAVVYDKYPDKSHHGWKFIAFGPDGKLYVPVGAPCNVCEEKDPVFASITRLNPDGSGLEIFAKGIRNTVGFAWHPDTKELWFTDNGRDNMGDDIPEDELNHAPNKDMHFGFPYCHQGTDLDPEFGKGKNCADYTPPVQKMGPHVAALGMRFYTAGMFPAEYRNRIFIAQHGSWNRKIPAGYRVMTVTLDGNKAAKFEEFATGWLPGTSEKDVIGRPVDVEVAADGALLISDDKQGVIYRVTYSK